MQSNSNLIVIWHDGHYRQYQQVKEGAWAKYQQIPAIYAKIICEATNGILEKQGSQLWTQRCIGFAISNGHITPKISEKYTVIYHDGQCRISTYNDANKAWQFYANISKNYAKCIFDDKKLLDSYGSDDWKNTCIGSIM